MPASGACGPPDTSRYADGRSVRQQHASVGPRHAEFESRDDRPNGSGARTRTMCVRRTNISSSCATPRTRSGSTRTIELLFGTHAVRTSAATNYTTQLSFKFRALNERTAHVPALTNANPTSFAGFLEASASPPLGWQRRSSLRPSGNQTTGRNPRVVDSQWPGHRRRCGLYRSRRPVGVLCGRFDLFRGVAICSSPCAIG